MLHLRILTAIFLIPLVLWGVIGLSSQWFEVITAVIFLLAAMEWTKLANYHHFFSKAIFLAIFGLTLLLLKATQWVSPLFSWAWCAIAAVFWFFSFYWIAHYQGKTPRFLKQSFNRAWMGILCLSAAWLALNLIRQLEWGREWIIFLFILIWSTDTFAYFAGRKWGSVPLAPYVSPKKTYEGFWGGIIGANVAALALVIILQWPGLEAFKPTLFEWKNLGALLSMVFVTTLLAVLGDLFESLLKRIVAIKDSGAILPGHGGILDRFDSLISALPFYALSLIWLQKI